MKKLRVKDKFLEEIRKYPIVGVALNKINLSRQTISRWRKEDEKFKTDMDQAMQEGDESQNDGVESAFMKNVAGGNVRAQTFYLEKRHPKYKKESIEDTKELAEKQTEKDEEERRSEVAYGVTVARALNSPRILEKLKRRWRKEWSGEQRPEDSPEETSN